jgi:ribosomal protein S18 acetylase RimI-like enzyme
MRPAKLVRYVNQFLLPTLGIESEISESTALRWLKKLGFKLCRVQKGIYVDGHERDDVIKARKEMIDYLEKVFL